MIQLVIGIVAAIALFIGGYFTGHQHGENAQKVADQAQFDKINRDLADQKTLANATFRAAQANIITLMDERDQFKTRLEQKYEQDQAENAAADRRLAYFSLRFKPEQGSRCRLGSGDPLPAGSDPASIAGPDPLVELPGPLAASLRSLARDADDLRAAYAKCVAAWEMK